LRSFKVETAQHAGLDTLSDVQLLHRAELTFDVLVTLDQAMIRQQNWAGRRLAVVVMRLTDQSPHAFDALAEHLSAVIQTAEPGEIVFVEGSSQVVRWTSLPHGP
jgi:predicted nuclease of predicted toxin-antitoxin system